MNKTFLLLLSFSIALAVNAQDLSELICSNFLSEDTVKLKPQVFGVKLQQPTGTELIYRKRDCQPVWYAEGIFLQEAEKLIDLIGNGFWDGLDPDKYNHSYLEQLLASFDPVELELYLIEADLLAAFDVLLTDSYLALGKDLATGCLDISETGLMYEIPRDSIDFSEELSSAVELADWSAFAKSMRPPFDQYQRTRREYHRLFNSEEDTLVINLEEGKLLRQGAIEPAVRVLRAAMLERYEMEDSLVNYIDTLAIDTISYEVDSIQLLVEREPFIELSICLDTIYFTPDSVVIVVDSLISRIDSLTISYDTLVLQRDSFLVVTDTIFKVDFYDSLLVSFIKRYQEDHYLDADGIVGPKTLKKMQRTRAEKLAQLRSNLEMWKWLPREMGDHYIVVNIPAYQLEVYRSDSVSLRKKVMVGAIATKTPVFSDMMRYIDFNPYWTVPYSIASREMLPRLRRDPGYLSRNNFELLSGGKSIRPSSVDWSLVSRSSFPYVIRQKPGKSNALGMMKFMFPNRYSVYLHDTQSKALFAKSQRAFSHGCVRVERPKELAEYLLQDVDKWDLDKINKTLKRGKNKRVNLSQPLPIYLVYQTVWVDDNGVAHYLDDVYGRDAAVAKLL